MTTPLPLNVPPATWLHGTPLQWSDLPEVREVGLARHEWHEAVVAYVRAAGTDALPPPELVERMQGSDGVVRRLERASRRLKLAHEWYFAFLELAGKSGLRRWRPVFLDRAILLLLVVSFSWAFRLWPDTGSLADHVLFTLVAAGTGIILERCACGGLAYAHGRAAWEVARRVRRVLARRMARDVANATEPSTFDP